MIPKKSLVAQFYNAAFDRRFKQEVADEREAVRLSLKSRTFFFDTYEQVSIDLDGQVLTGAPENRSARRYTGIDRLYTTAEVIAQYESELAQTASLRDTFERGIAREALAGVIAEYKKKYGPEDRFIPEPGRAGDFIGLSQDEKAFDHMGAQLWPQPKN
jgi:hypothetical protein